MPEQVEVVDMVELYITAELTNVEQSQNRSVFDESGCSSLHQLAARVYRIGFQEGSRAAARRADGDRRRARK